MPMGVLGWLQKVPTSMGMPGSQQHRATQQAGGVHGVTHQGSRLLPPSKAPCG